MSFQEKEGKIEWKVHFASPIEKVYDFLTADAGRRKFCLSRVAMFFYFHVKAFVLMAIILFSGCTFKQTHPLINGKITPLEWEGSKIIEIQNGYEMYLKQDDQYYFIAIKNRSNIPFYIDLFLWNNSDTIINIHSSAQLGERKLTESNWDDYTPVTNWGYINEWVSNVVLFDRAKMQQLKDENFEGNIFLECILPYDGFEFQFSKATWDLENSKVRIEMRNMANVADFEEIAYPFESDRSNYKRWSNLQF